MQRNGIQGQALRAFRESEGLSIEHCASLTDGRVSAETIARLESGETASHFSLRVLIASLRESGHECDLDNFLDLERTQAPSNAPIELRESPTSWGYATEPMILPDDEIGFEFDANPSGEDRALEATRVLVYTIHDGHAIPMSFADPHAAPIGHEHFAVERDWGANAIASVLSQSLGLRGHYHVNCARSVLDFGRFPRVTGAETDPLHYGAISNWTASKLANLEDQGHLLEFYDRLSSDWVGIMQRELELDHDGRDTLLDGAILIGVHTYDPRHANGKRRPPVSVISRPSSVQAKHALTPGVFDALFPPTLAEFTADRLLLSRIALEFERCYVPVATNYPYLLPEGSLELRTCVWLFFHWLERRARDSAVFENDVGSPAWSLLFDSLSNANSRQVTTHALRAFLSSNASPRGLPGDTHSLFEEAKCLHRRICDFVQSNRIEIVTAYQYSARRTSSFAIEIRKDLLFEPRQSTGTRFYPMDLIEDEVQRIGRLLAHSIVAYAQNDRPRKEHAELASDYPRWRRRELDAL